MNRIENSWSFKTRFTLIELLVVIAIISILMSILLPALAAAKRMTKSALCLQNHRQLGQGAAMYISDYGWNISIRYGTLPPGPVTTWYVEQMRDYFPKNKNVYLAAIQNVTATVRRRDEFACPEVKDWDTSGVCDPTGVTIGLNSNMSSIGSYDYKGYYTSNFKGPNFKAPSRLAMLMDCNGPWLVWINFGVASTTAMRHNRAMNVLYADQHANSRKEGSFSRYLSNPAKSWSTTSPFWFDSPGVDYTGNPD